MLKSWKRKSRNKFIKATYKLGWLNGYLQAKEEQKKKKKRK